MAIRAADASGLSDAEARALHKSIDNGYLLPTAWYADPGLFQLELTRIHRRAWHFATHLGDLQKPGDVYVRDLAGVPIVLVVDNAGHINGFINICRHRGHPVVIESGHQTHLRCPFHAWTYGLEGDLQQTPRAGGDHAFDPTDFGLIPIQTHVWGPMVWANLSPEAPPFERWVEGMPELMQSRSLNVADHAYGFDHTWEIECNWKVFQDNTIECYHCPSSHPTLARALEMRPALQDIQVGGRYWIHHTIPFRDSFSGSLTTRRVSGEPFNYYYHWVFPSTYLQYAGRGFDIGSLDIVSPGLIRFRHICFLPPDTPADALEQGRDRLARDATIWEDVALCNRVQKGHASGAAPTARVLAEPESLVSHFHHVIVDMLHDDPTVPVRMVDSG